MKYLLTAFAGFCVAVFLIVVYVPEPSAPVVVPNELAPHPRHGTRFSATGCDDHFERWNEEAKEYR